MVGIMVVFCGLSMMLTRNNHKDTFLLLALFTDEKRGKSHLRGLSSLLKNASRVHELVARAVRGECVRHRNNVKVGGFATLRNFNHTTRANIAHEIAEQIRARIVCTPAYKGVAGINTYAKHVCWRRRDGASWVWYLR